MAAHALPSATLVVIQVSPFQVRLWQSLEETLYVAYGHCDYCDAGDSMTGIEGIVHARST